jgi:hypothetical protein
MPSNTARRTRSIIGLGLAATIGLAPLARAADIGDPKPPRATAPPDSTATPDGPLDRPKTYAKHGGQAGALVGGLAMGGLFLLGAAYADGEGSDVDTPGYIGITLIGVTVGAIMGWALGSFLGSTVPAEHLPPGGVTAPGTTPAPEPAAPGVRTPSSVPLTSPVSRGGRTLASMTFIGGYAGMNGNEPTDGGALLGARLMRHRGDWVSYGPEVGFVPGHDGLFLLTGDVTVGPRLGSIRPYVIGDAGWHSWRDGGSQFGLGAGAGIDWARVPGGRAFGVELRYRTSVQNDPEYGDRSLFQGAATARFNW